MSIDISRHKRRRSSRTLMCNGGWGACEGQALALRGPGCVFFVVRGPVPRDRALILCILSILAILLQTECMRRTGPRATGAGGCVFFRRAWAVTPIPTRCRFSCIASLAPAIASSSCSSCASWPSCFRQTSGTAKDKPSPYVSTDNCRKLTPSRPVYAKTIPTPTSLATARKRAAYPKYLL